AFVIVLLLRLTLPWARYVSRHIPNALELWRYESVGEISDNTEKARGWWFYLPGLLQIALPWTPILIAALLNVHREKRLNMPFAWYAILVVLFSLLYVKKNAYLLPMMPAQTLLMALGLILLRVPRRTVLVASVIFIILIHAFFALYMFPRD